MNPARRLRILAVDDHDVVHRGMRGVLLSESWVERYLAAHSGEQALKLARRYEPHVALVDLFLAEESGAELCDRLKELVRVGIVLMSGVGSVTPPVVKAAGASGFVSKTWDAADIAEAVHMVGLGQTVFMREDAPPRTLLSHREHEVLALLAKGATNREIATELYLSPHTIKDHTTTLYRKMKARNRAEAVVRAQRLGLLS